MKDFKLIMLLSFIAGATGVIAVALMLGNGSPYCNGCAVRINAAEAPEELVFNKFCYPSIYSHYMGTPPNANTRLYPRTWLFAGNRDITACLQVMDKFDNNIVSF